MSFNTKVRNVYYNYILKTFTLTQKYYIEGTTISIQNDTVSYVTEGNDWSFDTYPSEIIYNEDRYLFSSTVGDSSSGTNLDSDKERIIYYTKYIPPVYTLTQKYYIKNTTTSIKPTVTTSLKSGSTWQFEAYPNSIIYNDDTYVFDSISGDSAMGINLDSNKERIIYYVRYEAPTTPGTGIVEFPLSIPMMSDLYNDTNMCYIREYFFRL